MHPTQRPTSTPPPIVININRRVLYGLLIIIALCMLASAGWACEEIERLAKFNGAAITRCPKREVTLSFDGPIVRSHGRTFVTLGDADARRVYEALAPYYKEKR